MATVWAWASSVEAYAACGKSVVVPRAVCGSCQDAVELPDRGRPSATPNQHAANCPVECPECHPRALQ